MNDLKMSGDLLILSDQKISQRKCIFKCFLKCLLNILNNEFKQLHKINYHV